MPDSSARPSDFDDVTLLNQLDGFNIQPRLSIPFSGDIDASSVTSGNVFLLRVRNAAADREHEERDDDRPRAAPIGVNQIVWDVATKTLHVKSDALLEQHTTYLLVVTRDVRDLNGRGETIARLRRL